MSLCYHQLDVELICAVITHESARSWNPEVVSFAGAMGLMQILPSTASGLAKQEGIAWSSAEDILFNPIYNVRLGCRYLAALIAEYGLEGGLAGYNGGGTQARRLLRGSSDLHPETALYVPEVLKLYRSYRSMRS
jgi:soluble lytic murein transglycosylase